MHWTRLRKIAHFLKVLLINESVEFANILQHNTRSEEHSFQQNLYYKAELGNKNYFTKLPDYAKS